MIGTEALKDTEQLKVTFAVPADAVDGEVAVVGDFNGGTRPSTPSADARTG